MNSPAAVFTITNDMQKHVSTTSTFIIFSFLPLKTTAYSRFHLWQPNPTIVYITKLLAWCKYSSTEQPTDMTPSHLSSSSVGEGDNPYQDQIQNTTDEATSQHRDDLMIANTSSIINFFFATLSYEASSLYFAADYESNDFHSNFIQPILFFSTSHIATFTILSYLLAQLWSRAVPIKLAALLA